MNLKNLFFAIALSIASAASWAGPVNINKADAVTLAAEIKGVGDKRAQAIVQYREEHGDFKSVDELANIKGIGEKIVDKNRENLIVSEEKK
ncbi:MAG: helix-hairpin-helix domain-containing protein [Gammaproteobacteria bacterium]|nr:MAG: helix-hairpin-helix domain-containing protein [Gammaproteobacteria bacterium]